ncbi:MAG TPA: gamma-glutamyltransferase, partial [Kiloniellales bacterium]|nr:gamma-glutamyltransferase [Kiloniellales bacterium]
LVARYAAEVAGRPAAPRGTTHISVVDAAGNLAAFSLSNGEGCGHLLPGSGIMLNNMLGEEDLCPQGFHAWPPGSRMASMMAPSLATRPDGGLVALGSGGSNRIRTAILQVLLNLLDLGLPLEAAVEAPRLHFEAGVLNLEGALAESAEALDDGVERTIAWPLHNLFFGGVHAVAREPDGSFSAAGDPRRGGCAIIV